MSKTCGECGGVIGGAEEPCVCGEGDAPCTCNRGGRPTNRERIAALEAHRDRLITAARAAEVILRHRTVCTSLNAQERLNAADALCAAVENEEEK